MVGAMTFWIENREPGTLHLFGDLDFATHERLAESLGATSGPVTLDMAAVSFMDSSGLRVILMRLKEGPVTIQSPNQRLVRLLELFGLTQIDGLSVSR